MLTVQSPITTDKVVTIQRAQDIAKIRNWMSTIFQNPQNYVFLDIETNRLHNAEVVEIAIADFWGNLRMHRIIKPKTNIELSATALHGINADDVEFAPGWENVYPLIKTIFNTKIVLTYNADWVCDAIFSSTKIAGVSTEVTIHHHCLMKAYSWVVGAKNEYDEYSWQKNPYKKYSAQDDVQGYRRLFLEMAAKIGPLDRTDNPVKPKLYQRANLPQLV